MGAMWTTATLFAAALAFGTAGGMVLALLRSSTKTYLAGPADLFMLVFRGIPALVILYACFFGLPAFDVQLSPFNAAVLGLGIWTSVYSGEIIRSGIDSVDSGQSEAAEALGMPKRYYMRRIVIPQGVRIMIPPFLTNAILLMKMTSLASTVAVLELTAAANRLVSLTFRPLEVYLSIATIYMGVISLMYLAQARLERAFALQE